MYTTPSAVTGAIRLPSPDSPAALDLVDQARITPASDRTLLQLALAAAFDRNSGELVALARRGKEHQQHVGYALNVYAAQDCPPSFDEAA